MIILPALIGEHSCGGWSCPLIYILECLYSNLCKFFHSPCAPASDGESLSLKHWLCTEFAETLQFPLWHLSPCCLPGSSDVCFYILTCVRDFAQQALVLKFCSGKCCGPVIKAEDITGTDLIFCWASWVWSHISHILAYQNCRCCSDAVLSVLERCCWEEGAVSSIQASALSHVMLTKLRCFWI